MGSWIIVATFIATALYLIVRERNFSPLPLLSCVATAILLCFFGLLFTAAINALLAQVSAPIDNSIGQALLVTLGALLGLGARQLWNQRSETNSRTRHPQPPTSSNDDL